jgi:hypothetical protein
MVRLFAVILVAVVALAGWLLISRNQDDEEAVPREDSRITSTPALAAIFNEALCRPPRDAETLRWDTRPYDAVMLQRALTASEEGQRVGAVRQTYLKVLLRDPYPGDCAGLRQWVGRDLPVPEIERRLAGSPEAARVAEVRKVFIDTLGRDPAGWDTASLRRWAESDLPAADIGARLAAQRPLVGVHYFAWYQSVQGQWGNGATFVSGDAPRPALGPYESADTDVIDTHIRQIVDAGFDFVILQVVPQTPWNWTNAHTFFKRVAGHPLKVAVMLDGLYTAPAHVKAEWVEKAKAEFTGYTNYFMYHDRPLVMLFASRVNFTVTGPVMRNIYWSPSYGPGANAFNPDSILHPHDWPFWAPTPQPLVNGVVPVIPGYVDSHLERPDPMVHPRDGGRMYHEQWQHALRQRPELIIVYSWNEYFEQTAIEPTNTWGDTYLKWTACYTRHAHAGTIGGCE